MASLEAVFLLSQMREAGFRRPLCGIADNSGKLPIKPCCIVGMHEASISVDC